MRSSRGLGKACAKALAREGCSVVINGLDPERLERAEATGAKVTPMRADINTEAGRAALIAASSDADILVNNNAGPQQLKGIGSGTQAKPPLWDNLGQSEAKGISLDIARNRKLLNQI